MNRGKLEFAQLIEHLPLTCYSPKLWQYGASPLKPCYRPLRKRLISKSVVILARATITRAPSENDLSRSIPLVPFSNVETKGYVRLQISTPCPAFLWPTENTILASNFLTTDCPFAVGRL